MSDAQTKPRPVPSSDDGGSTDGGGTTGPDEESTETSPLTLDQVFDVLRNERRRRALRYLTENGGQVEIGELAEGLASWETGKPVAEVTTSERKRVYVALYQCHLPRMDDVDVIEFDKQRGIIGLGRNAAALNRYLEETEKLRTVRPWHDETDTQTTDETTPEGPSLAWPRYYAAVVLLGVVLFAASFAVGGLATRGVFGGVLLAAGTVCAFHLRSVRGEIGDDGQSGD